MMTIFIATMTGAVGFLLGLVVAPPRVYVLDEHGSDFVPYVDPVSCTCPSCLG